MILKHKFDQLVAYQPYDQDANQIHWQYRQCHLFHLWFSGGKYNGIGWGGHGQHKRAT